jgi:hypothetical protein
VLNAGGTLVSRLEPGLALAFEPQSAPGAQALSSFIGCVVKKDGKWMLYEPVLKLLVELRGQPALVESEWGNRVQANGTAATSGQATDRQVMTLTTITRIEAGGCEEMARLAAAELPAAPPAPAPATRPATPGPETAGRGGMSAGTKYGIIAAVAGGGAAAGIAAAAGKRSR